MVEVFIKDISGTSCEEIKKMAANLSKERQEKAEEYALEEDRRLSVAAGHVLKTALAAWGIRNEEIVYGEHGKPYLASGEAFFSLSHSGTVAICAIAEKEVGADIERIRPFSRRLIEKVCTDREREALEKLEGEEQSRLFFDFWTAKESVMKLTGSGLSLAPDRIGIGISPLRAEIDGIASGLYLCSYPYKDYSLTVCCK